MEYQKFIYNQADVISFSNTKAAFGALSNMAADFPLFVNEINIPTAEALYQCCRFPLFPNIQQEIIEQASPITAKQISRKYMDKSRQDWDMVKEIIMRWCLEVKLIQNWDSFAAILKQTGNKPIVEYSDKDKYWAASPLGNGKLQGNNALGRLLMQLRDKYALPNKPPDYILPPPVIGFILLGFPIQNVYPAEYYCASFQDADVLS